MNYQNLLCIGDSQTFGARSYGCYPIWLADILMKSTPYVWRVINKSVNGYTARDLWFKLNNEIEGIQDTYQACVMIGTNDAGNFTDLYMFKMYLRQIVLALIVKQYRAIFLAEIPPIFPDGHIFFNQDSTKSRDKVNKIIREICIEFKEKVHFVPLLKLTREDYEDPVHFNENGNKIVAESFAKSILSL